MSGFDLKIDFQAAEAVLKDLPKSKADLIMMRATNRAITTAAATMRKETAQKYRIKSTDVGKTLVKLKANRHNPTARIISRGRHINLAKFKASPNRPVKYGKPKGRGHNPSPKVYKAAVRKEQEIQPLGGENKPFIAVMSNGFQGMFRRKTRQTTKGRNNSIIGVSGPSVPQMLSNDAIQKSVIKEAENMMLERLDHEINRVL